MSDSKERVIAYSVLGLGTLVAVYPLLSILALALSTPDARPNSWGLPQTLEWSNFTRAWDDGGFDRALTSSAFVSISVVVLTIALAIPAAFALTGSRSRALTALAGLLLIGLVLPYEGIIVPMYQMLDGWNLINSYPALILPQVGLSMSFAVLWLRVAFADIPKTLVEAAHLDGAGRARTLVSVLLPNLTPAILTLATLLFLFTWNEFLLALVLVPENPDVQTAPLALSFFAGNRRTGDPAVTAAAACLVALPVLLMYVFLQRRFINGILSGSVKE